MKRAITILLLAGLFLSSGCKKEDPCESAYFNLRMQWTWKVRALEKENLPADVFKERYNQAVNLTNALAQNVEGCRGDGWKEIPIME